MCVRMYVRIISRIGVYAVGAYLASIFSVCAFVECVFVGDVRLLGMYARKDR